MKIVKFQHSNKMLWYHIGEHITSEQVAKDLEYPIRSNENCTWFVAFDGNAVIGFCCAEKRSGHNYFKCDYVLPDQRGRGIYGELFKKRLFEVVGEKRATCNDNSLKTYLKNGFAEVGKNGKYTKVILK